MFIHVSKKIFLFLRFRLIKSYNFHSFDLCKITPANSEFNIKCELIKVNYDIV